MVGAMRRTMVEKHIPGTMYNTGFGATSTINYSS